MDKKNIQDLEKLDNILLKRILELPSSKPSAFLHLELGTIPIICNDGAQTELPPVHLEGGWKHSHPTLKS